MKLHCSDYGEGYPLIILHGLFGSSENWQTVSRSFARCYRVLALDLRNHGRSPHSDVFNYRVMASDVVEFMQEQGFPSAYVLGHSMGGKTAMQMALTFPERVDKLVVVDIAPKAYPPEQDEILQALLSIDPAAFRKRKDVVDSLARQIPDLALRQFLLKNLEREESGGFRWRLGLDEIQRNYPEIIEAVQGDRPFRKPTLFIRGELSNYIGEEDIPSIKGLFPFSKIVTVPRVGHWVHSEARRRFARLVIAFLGSV